MRSADNRGLPSRNTTAADSHPRTSQSVERCSFGRVVPDKTTADDLGSAPLRRSAATVMKNCFGFSLSPVALVSDTPRVGLIGRVRFIPVGAKKRVEGDQTFNPGSEAPSSNGQDTCLLS